MSQESFFFIHQINNTMRITYVKDQIDIDGRDRKKGESQVVLNWYAKELIEKKLAVPYGQDLATSSDTKKKKK